MGIYVRALKGLLNKVETLKGGLVKESRLGVPCSGDPSVGPPPGSKDPGGNPRLGDPAGSILQGHPDENRGFGRPGRPKTTQRGPP